MPKSLFRKEMEPRCTYCAYSGPLTEQQLTCLKKGVVSAFGSCKKFSYDPLKRVPPRPAAPRLDQFKNEDFSL